MQKNCPQIVDMRQLDNYMRQLDNGVGQKNSKFAKSN